MELVVEEKQLHVIIKQAVDEAFKENITRLKVAMIPTVDDEEMDEDRGQNRSDHSPMLSNAEEGASGSGGSIRDNLDESRS